MTESDMELLRRIDAGKPFVRASDDPAGHQEFQALAARLFALERKGFVSIPPKGYERSACIPSEHLPPSA
jgi:hypothetical protein